MELDGELRITNCEFENSIINDRYCKIGQFAIRNKSLSLPFSNIRHL